MPERTSISPPPASPRKVRFGVESVGHIAGDSSDEEDDFDPDSMVESYATATSPSAKDQEDSQMRYGENFGHESPRGRIAESDNDVSNRGRRSNRGALGKKVSTSFVRRGNNSEDDGGEVEAKDSRVTHGSSAGPDESTLKKRTSTIEKGEKSTSRGGRSPCRAASSKRSSTPFAKKRVSWKHENDDENENDREVSEKNGSVVVHASSQDRNMDDGAMRTGRSADQNDGEPVSVRQGRSSGRGSTAKRSTTPFARRSVDWEDEDDGEGAEPASGNKSDSNAQFDPRERKSESDDDSHVMRGRSSSENDDGPTLSSRGRSSSRGTRAKRSSTPFFRRDVHWTEEDESSDDGADAQSASAKGKDYNVAETSSDMGLLHGPVNEKDEGAEKVGRIGLVVHQEKEECLATAKEDDEQRDGQLGTDAVRKNGAGTNERGKDKHHQATVLDNGDLQVIVPCSCGKVQILTYNSRTGVNIEPC